MNERIRKIILVSIVTMAMLLSVFSAVPMGASSQSTLKASVGTVTLSPATGAFPGQIVYFTWTGVPTDLVPPVYVTVYLNGAAYSTSVAYYDSGTGTLKGSFVMPNDEPGTVFDVSFSYRDSAKNYGTNTVSDSGDLYLTVSPTEEKEDKIEQPVSVPYEFNADTHLGTPGPDYIESDSDYSSGNSLLTINSTSQEPISGGTTPLENNSVSQGIALVEKAEFAGWATFTNNSWEQNVTLNATPVKGAVTSVPLPNPLNVPTQFTFTQEGATGWNITHIKVDFTTTVSMPGGHTVTLHFYADQDVHINSTGDTSVFTENVVLGTFTATNDLGTLHIDDGAVSYNYKVSVLGFDGTNYHVTYSLTMTFDGTYEDVEIHGDYQCSERTASGTSNPLNDTASLTRNTGYIKSPRVDLVAPGIKSTTKFVFNFYNSAYGWVNDTYMTFSNFTNVPIASLVGKDLYFNQTVEFEGFNETLVLDLNITIYTVSYSPGLFAISPAIWKFQVNYTFGNNNTHINVTGNTYGAYYEDEFAKVVVTESQFGNSTSQWYLVPTNASLETMLGYPLLEKIIVHERFDTISFLPGGFQTMSLGEATIDVNEVISSTGTYDYLFNRTISGFNETEFAGDGTLPAYSEGEFTIDVESISPVIYGVETSGAVVQTWEIQFQANNTNGFIDVVEMAGSSISTSYCNVTVGLLSNTWDFAGPSENTVTLKEYTWRVYGGEFTAYLQAVFLGYSGSLEFWGAGNDSSVLVSGGVISGPGDILSIKGNITEVNGFANNSAIGGWMNATVSVSEFHPALYGIDAFDGLVNISLHITIGKNNTEEPYFLDSESYLKTYGWAVVPNEAAENFTVTGLYYDSYMKLYAILTPVELQNVSISGSLEVTWPTYGIDTTYTFQTNGTYELGSEHSGVSDDISISTPDEFWFNQTSGEPEMTDIDVSLYFKANIGEPIVNVTLQPIVQTYFYIYGEMYYYDFYYVEFTAEDMYAILLNVNNGGENTYSSIAGTSFSPYNYVYQNITLYNYEITLKGNVGGVDFVTATTTVSSVGDYYLMGTANYLYGSGTLTGVLEIDQHIPYFYLGYLFNNITLSADLNIHVFNADGSQVYINVELPSGMLSNSVTTMENWVASVPYSLTTVTESPNEGTYTYGSYNLEQGSGALIVTLSDEQIATIVTRLGDVVNISLEQLDAKLVGIWSDVNDTYALVETAYGDMSAKLDAIDAKITDVKNGIATIQTALGNIQTSLDNLDAKITSLQGDVATLETKLGKIQVSLDDINATVVANAKSLDDLKGSVVEIQTSLGDIKGVVTDIKDGVATIKTDLGTVKTDVSDIKTTTENTSGSVSTTLYWEIGVLVLVIITLILVAYVIIKVNKISAGGVKEETIEEEETE